MERLIDQAAREMGIDRIEIRKRNHIKPKEMPYKTPSENVYDSGNFPALFKRALELADVKGFAKRKKESKKHGKLRGLGFGSFLEQTAPMAKELGGIRFEIDGTVTIITGSFDFGQGHATPFAQILSSRLGIPFERIRLLQGDSDQLPLGGGTGGSKSAMMSGNAIAEGSAKVIEQGKQIAAFVLEASPGDIEFKPGRFTIAGTDRSVGIMELADKIRGGLKIPADLPQIAQRHACQRRRAGDVPERRACRRSRDRPGDRRRRSREIRRSQRFRHGTQSDAGRWPGSRRSGAGHRPGADGKHRLRRTGSAPDRIVHGLCHAARRGRAEL